MLVWPLSCHPRLYLLALVDGISVELILSTYYLMKEDAGLSLCLQEVLEFREDLHISNW